MSCSQETQRRKFEGRHSSSLLSSSVELHSTSDTGILSSPTCKSLKNIFIQRGMQGRCSSLMTAFHFYTGVKYLLIKQYSAISIKLISEAYSVISITLISESFQYDYHKFDIRKLSQRCSLA